MPLRRGLIRFAHRGASALAPENTLTAFEEAVRLGCCWIETDLRLTADGVTVLLHDATVDRTTGGRGPVGRMALAQLKRLDAGSWFGREFRSERVPTLDEALEWGRERCELNLEIKEEDRPEQLLEQAARRVRAHRALDRVLFSSFRGDDLRPLSGLLPGVRLGWLISRSSRGLKSLAREVNLASLHPKESMVNPRLVRRCHRAGIAVHAWVVNRAARLAELESLGVDGVMTDDPRIFSLV